EEPRDRESCRRRPALDGEGPEALERVEDPHVAKMLVRLGAHRHPRARGRGHTAPVLAGEPASGERAEGREAEAVLGAEREHAGLGLAIEERIRVLYPAEAAGGNRLPELRAVDVREAV